MRSMWEDLALHWIELGQTSCNVSISSQIASLWSAEQRNFNTDSNIRFTDEEFHTIHPDRIDNAIKLPDGGYFGSLFVYHELHCLVSVNWSGNSRSSCYLVTNTDGLRNTYTDLSIKSITYRH